MFMLLMMFIPVLIPVFVFVTFGAATRSSTLVFIILQGDCYCSELHKIHANQERQKLFHAIEHTEPPFHGIGLGQSLFYATSFMGKAALLRHLSFMHNLQLYPKYIYKSTVIPERVKFAEMENAM